MDGREWFRGRAQIRSQGRVHGRNMRCVQIPWQWTRKSTRLNSCAGHPGLTHCAEWGDPVGHGAESNGSCEGAYVTVRPGVASLDLSPWMPSA